MSVFRFPIIAASASAVLGVGLAHMSPETVETSLGAVRQVLHLDVNRPLPSPQGRTVDPTPVRVVSNPWRTEIEPDAGGQFMVDMIVNGQSLGAMVDTGATYVFLSYESAASVGFHPSPAEFKYVMNTANGSARTAAAIISRIQVGNVEARNVQAVISQPGALTTPNLLGMSFLRKLSGFQVEAGRLVLKQ